VSRRRLAVLLTLITCGVLAVGLPVSAGDYKPGPVLETNGAGDDGPLKDMPGNAAIGKKLFVVFCGKCHVMKAAGTKGTLGPNLDRDQVSYTNVVNAVVQGVGGIQAEYLLRVMKFQQLYDVAKFVTTARR
jgi:mono/diheme cytochrome c family protein